MNIVKRSMSVILCGVFIHRLLPSLALCTAFFAPALHAAEPTKPNVVLIPMDDFGYECVTADGGESYKTPVSKEKSARIRMATRCRPDREE